MSATAGHSTKSQGQTKTDDSDGYSQYNFKTSCKSFCQTNWYCMWPIAACLVVFLGALLTQDLFISGDGSLGESGLSCIALDHTPHLIRPSTSDLNNANTARIVWSSASFLNSVICIIAVVAGGTLIAVGPLAVLDRINESQTEQPGKKRADKRRWRWVFLAIGIAIAVAAGALLINPYLVQTKIADQLLRVIEANEVNGNLVREYLKILNGATFTTAIFLIILSSIALFQPNKHIEMLNVESDGPSPKEREQKVINLCHYMAEQARECRIIFYLGTAVLVTAIMHLHAFYGWAIAYYMREDSQDLFRLRPLLETTASAWGTYATLILLAIFLPTFIILRLRAFKLVHRIHPNIPQQEQEEWLERHGLIGSNFQYVAKVAAILSPFLIGQLSEVVKNF